MFKMFEKTCHGFSQNCPETVLIFVSFKRDAIAAASYQSLSAALAPVRDRIKIVVSDSSPPGTKLQWLAGIDADDVIWTPKKTSAATARNLAVQLALDKYASEFLCFLEDDYLYEPAWYPTMVRTARANYGRMSPWGVPYGMFSASRHQLESERVRPDKANGLTAYVFGAVADQRFMPTHHYLSVLRMWDPDGLGISYCQTGMQTARNTMRGFCGGILTDPELCRPVPEGESTWSGGKRDVGPPAHDLNPDSFNVIRELTKKSGTYEREENK